MIFRLFCGLCDANYGKIENARNEKGVFGIDAMSVRKIKKDYIDCLRDIA